MVGVKTPFPGCSWNEVTFENQWVNISIKDSKEDLGLYRFNWIIFIAYLPEGMYTVRH